MKLFDRMRDETRGGLHDGFHDCTVNFRLWRNIVSRKKPHEWQLTTFWYWLNYSGGN
jgi:hypothetical protein